MADRAKSSTTLVTVDDLWIRLQEQEPKDGQFVIVWIDRSWQGDASSAAGRCHYEGAGKFDLSTPAGDVTHWMPWPQSPPSVERSA